MTVTKGHRWCKEHREWERAPICVACGEMAKLQLLGRKHKWWWPCGHAAENAASTLVVLPECATCTPYLDRRHVHSHLNYPGDSLGKCMMSGTGCGCPQFTPVESAVAS